MVVVPALAVGDQTYQPVVAAVVLGLVVSVSPDMGHGVDAPGDVPVENRSDEYPPDEQARCELDAAPEVSRHEPTDDKADDRIEGCDGKIDLEPIPLTLEFQVERVFQEVSGEALVVFDVGEISVLKHQPTEVSPEERDQGAVRIGLMVRVLMMDPVHGDPTSWSVLHRADAEQGQGVFEPLRCVHPSVGQESMVTDVDPQGSEDIEPEDAQSQTGPTEEPRDKRQAGQQVDQRYRNRIPPTDLDGLHGRFGPRERLARIGRQNLRWVRGLLCNALRWFFRHDVDRHGVCGLRE